MEPDTPIGNESPPEPRPGGNRRSGARPRRKRLQHWRYVGFDEVQKAIEETAGVPADAVKALTVAFFLCARRPTELSKIWNPFRVAMFKLLKWVSKEGGPNIALEFAAIEKAFMRPPIAFPRNTISGESYRYTIEGVPMRWGMRVGLDGRPRIKGPLKTDHSRFHSPKFLYSNANAGSFITLAFRVLVESGCKSGVPSERRYAAGGTMPKKKQVLAVFPLKRLAAKLLPAVQAREGVAKGSGRSRQMDSIVRQARGREVEPGKALSAVRAELESIVGNFKDHRAWIPDDRK